jgi:protein MpaA
MVMQRLGKNIGSYQGDRIQVTEFLAQIEKLASAQGWQNEPMPLENGLILPGFRRAGVQSRSRVYISSGIHGDEPAGVLALCQMFQEKLWPKGLDLWILPCLNPRGFDLGTRENEDGLDLNRDYRSLKAAVTRGHIQWLQKQPSFDFTLCLHEDWEAHGFYLYELNPDLRPSVSEKMIDAARKVCPIDLSPEIEGRKASGGIICANPDLLKRPDWPEAFYLIHHKTRTTYTLESPSDFPMSTRVAALVAAVTAALEFAALGN